MLLSATLIKLLRTLSKVASSSTLIYCHTQSGVGFIFTTVLSRT